MSRPRGTTLLSWIGLLVASSVWAINTQLGQILPYLDCQQQARFSAIASFAGMIFAALAGAISWRSTSSATMSGSLPRPDFAGSLSAISAMIFAFALAMQGMASVVLSGCER